MPDWSRFWSHPVAASVYGGFSVAFLTLATPPQWIDNPWWRVVFGILGSGCAVGAVYEWRFRKPLAAVSANESSLTNIQLCRRADDVTRRMRDLEAEYKLLQNAVLSSRDHSTDDFLAVDTEYRNRAGAMRGEAIWIRDELANRLPREPQLRREAEMVFFERGSVAGVRALGEAADQIEQLSRKLCP